MTFRGGPLNGTYDFPNYSMQMPSFNDSARLIAWSYYTFSGTAVGTSSMEVSQALLKLINKRQNCERTNSPDGKYLRYLTIQRTVSGDDVSVLAAYLPPGFLAQTVGSSISSQAGI